MSIDNIRVGERIRTIREQNFKENREDFSERLMITPGYLGKIERGEMQISIKLLEKITKITGASTDYILFDRDNNKISYARKNINFILDNCTEDELKVYSRIITTVQSYVCKMTEK